MGKMKKIFAFFFATLFVFALVGNAQADTPIVTAFEIPATSNSLTVPITTLTATDGIAVVGFFVSESEIAPDLLDPAWIPEAPAAYVFSTSGTKTLYAWVKDALGNVSLSLSASVDIVLVVAQEEVIPPAIVLTVEVAASTPAAQVVETKKSSSKKKSKKKKKSSSARKISNSKSKVTRGAVLIQRGSKFSKNSFVNLYFSKVGGGFYPPSKVKTSASGGFSISYKVSKPAGSYSWYAIDLATGKKSKAAGYRVK